MTDENQNVEEPKLKFVTALRPEADKLIAANIYQGISKAGETYYCYRLSRTYMPKNSDEAQYMDWFFGESAKTIFEAAKLADKWIATTKFSQGVPLSAQVVELLKLSIPKQEQANIRIEELRSLERKQNQPKIREILLEFANRKTQATWSDLRDTLELS